MNENINDKGFGEVLIIVGVTIVILAILFFGISNTFIGTYNKLVTDRQTVLTQQGDLEAQMQRRFDIINETVGAVKGALGHEDIIFNDIAKQQAAFTQAHNTGNVQGELNANSAVSASIGQALRGYFVVQQQYPQEYALQNVKDLQTNIDGSENRISTARQRYNNTVQIYDTELSTFPTVWINGTFFHLQPLPYYQNDTESNKAPSVNLGQ